MPDPVTRKALDALRANYDNTAEFLVSLMEDPLLRHKIKIVTYDLQDLHREYIEERYIKCPIIAVSTIVGIHFMGFTLFSGKLAQPGSNPLNMVQIFSNGFKSIVV